MSSDTTEIQKSLKRAHKGLGSWSKAGNQVLGIDPRKRGLACLIASGKRDPTPKEIAYFREVYLPTLQRLPDATDIEAISDAVLREIMVQSKTAKDLADTFLVPVYRVRQAIRLLREAGILILPSRKGYCLPESEEETEAAIRLLEARRGGLDQTIRLLRVAQRRAFSPMQLVGMDISHSVEVLDVD